MYHVNVSCNLFCDILCMFTSITYDSLMGTSKMQTNCYVYPQLNVRLQKIIQVYRRQISIKNGI